MPPPPITSLILTATIRVGLIFELAVGLLMLAVGIGRGSAREFLQGILLLLAWVAMVYLIIRYPNIVPFTQTEPLH